MNYLRLAVFMVSAFSFFTSAQAISDNSFDRFIKPLSNPVYLEGPRSETRIHFVHVLQTIPSRVHTERGSLSRNGRLNLTDSRITYAPSDYLSAMPGMVRNTSPRSASCRDSNASGNYHHFGRLKNCPIGS